MAASGVWYWTGAPLGGWTRIVIVVGSASALFSSQNLIVRFGREPT